jgi:hypothetical protein
MTDVLQEPVSRVNIKIYASDLKYLQLEIGYGWTTQIRLLIREYIIQLKAELERDKEHNP